MITKKLIGVEYETGEREIFFEYTTAAVEAKIKKERGSIRHKFFDPSLDFGKVRNKVYRLASI